MTGTEQDGSDRFSEALRPGAVIGILGGGQLGRMLALAAARLGMRCHIYCPDPQSPAFDIAAETTVAAYDDPTALSAFAAACDVVTYEFENVPALTVDTLSPLVPARPGRRPLAVCQDRLEEKRLLEGLDIGSASWRQVDSLDDLRAGIADLGGPCVLKTRRLGYDGKGQARLKSEDDADRAYEAIAGAPAILEAFVPFSREVSVVCARGVAGDFAAYDVAENHHDAGILRVSRVPARISEAGAAVAVDIARRIAEALGHVGVMAVEMFLLRDDSGERLLVNELAPRVHNSGHWTIEACPASQFEAHIRAIAGWPVPSTARIGDATMTNLIGDEALDWQALASEPGAALHLYGKRAVRPGRKMGHVTRVRPFGA